MDNLSVRKGSLKLTDSTFELQLDGLSEIQKQKLENFQNQNLPSETSRNFIEELKTNLKKQEDTFQKKVQGKKKGQARRQFDPLIKMLSQGQALSYIHKPPRECQHIREVSDASENLLKKCTVCKTHEFDFKQE